MKDLLLVTTASFALGLLLVQLIYGVPWSIGLAAFWFTVVLPAAGALLVGRLERRAGSGPGGPL